MKISNYPNRISFLPSLAACGVMAFSLMLSLPANAEEDGFKPISNGENLDGWDGLKGYWSVEDGAIVGQFTADNPVKHNTFLIWEEGELKDFELPFKYRIASDKANSGVKMSELVDDGPEAASSGILAFQLHQGPPMRIEFKDIHLKAIEASE